MVIVLAEFHYDLLIQFFCCLVGKFVNFFFSSVVVDAISVLFFTWHCGTHHCYLIEINDIVNSHIHSHYFP